MAEVLKKQTEFSEFGEKKTKRFQFSVLLLFDKKKNKG